MGALEEATKREEPDFLVRAKQSTSMRVKKNVSSAVATSHTGKDVIRKFVGKKALATIDIVKDLITLHEDKKKATEIENNIIKIAVKVILLFQNKDLSEKNLTDLVPKVESLWVSVLNYSQMPFTYDAITIKTSAEDMIDSMTTQLAPFLSEKNISLLRETAVYLQQKELLDLLFEKEEQEPMRKDLARILNNDWAKSRFITNK
uniref:Uncharacterized protein n=1 Tax=Arcella intermedia TaxID=1963864 RepID=A0A6B2LHX9_9EUKA